MGPSQEGSPPRGTRERPSEAVAVRFKCLKLEPKNGEISFSYRTSPAGACDCTKDLDGIGQCWTANST